MAGDHIFGLVLRKSLFLSSGVKESQKVYKLWKELVEVPIPECLEQARVKTDLDWLISGPPCVSGIGTPFL